MNKRKKKKYLKKLPRYMNLADAEMEPLKVEYRNCIFISEKTLEDLRCNNAHNKETTT